MKNNLASKRCLLTPVAKTDFASFKELRTNPQIRQYLGGPVPLDSLGSWFFQVLNPEEEVHIWAVREKSSEQFVGLLTLDPHHRQEDMQISYEFLPAFWGQGYASETIQVILQYIFEDLDWPKIVAETQTANMASVRLLERLGFVRKETLYRFGAEQSIYLLEAHKK